MKSMINPKLLAFYICLLLSGQTLKAQDFKTQHIEDNIGNTGGTNTAFTPVASLTNAVALPTNNRKTHAGSDGSSGAKEGNDMAGARVLTATNMLTYYRESTSTAEDNRFNTSIWEYIGSPGGANEMIVRGRYAIDLNGGTYTVNQAISGVVNKDKCIPFITGIMNNSSTEDADSSTAIAYLTDASTLRVEKGGTNTPNVRVYITLVEFTGANWSVFHGDSGNVGTNSGTITLNSDADGSSGATANVTDWGEAMVFTQHRGDTAIAGTNDSHSDNWPTMIPGNSTSTVQWDFFSTHDSDGTNRHFVHVLNNTSLDVTRYTDTGFDKSILLDITASGLTDLSQAMIIGSTYHSGTGAGYGRGWKNYSFNSTNEVEIWTHRSGSLTSTISTQLQIVNFAEPISAPGNITNNISLWLKADDGVEEADGDDAENLDTVLNWLDSSGNSNNALQATGANQPIFNDSAINYNPALNFDGINHEMATTVASSGTMTIFAVGEGTYSGSTKNILNLNGGGIGSVIIEQTSATTAQGRYFDGITPTGVVSTTIANTAPFLLNYNFVAGANSELFDAGSTQGTAATNVNTLPPSLTAVIGGHPTNTTRRWDGGIAEILVYNGSITAAERDKIESYFAIKYGFTLGGNGTGQDYVDSDGRVIWDQTLNSGYDHNITGIGRDDVSSLMQKQSQTVNTTNDITIGIKDIASTNTANTNSFFADKTFLMWGHNNGATTSGTIITKDYSTNTGVTTPVSATPIERRWKIVVTDSIPAVKLSIPETMVSDTNSGSDTYIMIISDDATFTTNVTSATMKLNGGNLEANFYFEGTKYITFGSTEVSAELSRSVAFDGTDKYLTAGNVNDLANIDFTISAWIKRNPGADKFDIVSKRNYFDENLPSEPGPDNDGRYTHGYAFRINSSGQLRMVWRDPDDATNQTLQTSATIPEDEWHHIAATYESSTNTTRLYIDGYEEDSDDTLDPINTPSDSHFLIGAAHHIRRQQRCQGNVDEVRVWNTTLSADQIRYIINQEIENNSNFADGKVLPTSVTRNDINPVPWANLIAYYPMSQLVFGSIKDASNSGNDASMINYSDVDEQTAPIPYKTAQNGNWDDPNTWLNGNVQYLPGVDSYLDALETIDYNIAVIDHEITMSNSDTSLIPSSRNGNRTLLALTVNSGGKLIIDGDNATHSGYSLTVSHYLKLDGVIDLEGESQLIQELDSDLDSTSVGVLQKDQQGTRDMYTYNYWGSPVGFVNGVSNNIQFRLNDNILKNGTVSATPTNINFVSNSFNGSVSGNDITIADYWVWKFTNANSNDFTAWVQVRSNGVINVGEGFTMKGVTDTSGLVSQTQNYVFEGKPNNGNVTLPLSAGSDYLVGNPYPSAIDANEFILDNISDNGGRAASNIIDGTLYFWDHFGGSSHQLSSYEGGYATYTLAGGIVAINNDTRINATGAFGTKVPGRYIPVAQGFFVVSDAGGNVQFKNSQRKFEKEGSLSSVFSKAVTSHNSTDDTRQKIKLMMSSPDGYYRQILVSKDENTTDDFDIGYDAKLIEDNREDMYWVTPTNSLVIQAVPNFDDNKTLALGVKIYKAGLTEIKIDTLKYIDSKTTIISIFDKSTGVYHNLQEGSFEIFLEPGIYDDRFELVFSKPAVLSTNTSTLDNLEVHFLNDSKSIVIQNPNLVSIDTVEIYNNLGQLISSQNNVASQKIMTTDVAGIASGLYIVNIKTAQSKLAKKIIAK